MGLLSWPAIWQPASASGVGLPTLRHLALLKMLQKTIGGPLVDVGSPLKFAPREGPEFFAPYGWQSVETTSLLRTAAKLKRLSFGMRLLSLSPRVLLAASPKTSRGEESAYWRTRTKRALVSPRKPVRKSGTNREGLQR